MPTVIGIAGALRRDSYNVALLRAAVELAPAGLSIAGFVEFIGRVAR
jgi:NAD(P)H-dependent FMN reductase